VLPADVVKTGYDVYEESSVPTGMTDMVKVKNTFIEVNGGMDLKSMLQEGRQIRSCPGSRLTTPRAKGDVGRPTESSQASTADTTEADAAVLVQQAAITNRMCDVARAALAREGQVEHFDSLRGLEHPASTIYYDQRTAASRASAFQQAQVEHLHVDSLRELDHPGSTVYYDQRTEALVASAFQQAQASLDDQRMQASVAASQQAHVLLLANALAVSTAAPRVATGRDKGNRGRGQLMLGSPEVPSVGSLGHATLRCKPCAFFARSGCANGVQCGFCHLCDVGEKKRRRKEKRSLIAATRKVVSMSAEA